jgi:hypothetical protein
MPFFSRSRPSVIRNSLAMHMLRLSGAIFSIVAIILSLCMFVSHFLGDYILSRLFRLTTAGNTQFYFLAAVLLFLLGVFLCTLSWLAGALIRRNAYIADLELALDEAKKLSR